MVRSDPFNKFADKQIKIPYSSLRAEGDVDLRIHEAVGMRIEIGPKKNDAVPLETVYVIYLSLMRSWCPSLNTHLKLGSIHFLLIRWSVLCQLGRVNI